LHRHPVLCRLEIVVLSPIDAAREWFDVSALRAHYGVTRAGYCALAPTIEESRCA
jgi:hypothetical protein